MAKRQADTELTQDNWDQDLPVKCPTEDGGLADGETLAKRKILVPKSRRSNVTSGLFKSLTGFSANSPSVPTFSFGVNQKATAASGQQNLSAVSTVDLHQETEYLKELQTLNRNLLEWVEKHVKSDPHCILSPVFVDYENHLKRLHEKYPNQQVPDSTSTTKPFNFSLQPNGSVETKSSLAEPKVTLPSLPVSLPKTTMPSPFSSLTATQPPATNESSTAKPAFTFSLPPLTSGSSAPPLFKFGNSLPSSSPFASQSATTTEATPVPEEDDDAEYQPPKPVVREIKEEDSVYSVRCKLFYKAESEWRERGVGNLFIKPHTADKFQLLIRADTNLGNILLNVLITKDIPVKVQKNNLTLVCVPTPPLPTSKASKENGDTVKPALFLIRVKTEDAATELLKQIDQHRGMGQN